MLILVFICILIGCVSCRNPPSQWLGPQELRFMYYLDTNNSSEGHEVKNELQFEVGQTLTLTCSTLYEDMPMSKLRWEVDKFKLRSNEKSNSSFEYIALTFTLDRDFNGTNVVCVGEDNGHQISKNVTLLLQNSTSFTKPQELISVTEGNPLKTPVKDYHCIVNKNSKWTKFNNLSNILIDQLKLDDNESAVLCANLNHTEQVQKRPPYENFDLYIKRWRVIVTKLQTDNATRVTTEKDDENDIEIKKDKNHENDIEVKQDENDEGVKQVGHGKEVKQDDNDREVKQDVIDKEVKKNENHENDKGVKQGRNDKDIRSQSNTTNLFPIIGVAVGLFALLIVLIIIIAVYFKRKHLELHLMNHVYAEPQYDAMAGQQNSYYNISVVTRKKKPCLPPRNKPHDAIDVEDPGIQVTNSGYVSTESFQILAGKVQMNMNNYTTMH